MKKLVLGPVIILALLVVYILFEVQIVDFMLRYVNNGSLASYGIWRLEVLERKDKILIALQSPQAKTKLFALWSCANHKWLEAAPEVTSCLTSKNPELFAAANEAAQKFQGTDIVRQLLQNLSTYNDLKTIKQRTLTATTLGYHKDEEAAKVMLSILKKLKSYKWRVFKIALKQAIAKQGCKASKSFFITQLKRGVDPQVIIGSALSVKNLGMTEAAAALANRAKWGPDAAVQIACIEALETLGSPPQVAILKTLSKNKNKHVREAALKALKVLSF